MTILPPNDDPRDMRDLLIRLDQKVGDGFTSITEKLDAMERRSDTHDQRLRVIELEIADRPRLKIEFDAVKVELGSQGDRLAAIETAGRVTSKIAAALWAACGTGIIGMIGFLISLFVKS